MCSLFTSARQCFRPRPKTGRRSAPGFDERLGLGLVGLHDQVTALAGLADVVGAQRKTQALGRTTFAFEADVTPPSSIVVPDVVVRPVFTIRQIDEFVFHRCGQYTAAKCVKSTAYDKTAEGFTDNAATDDNNCSETFVANRCHCVFDFANTAYSRQMVDVGFSDQRACGALYPSVGRKVQ